MTEPPPERDPEETGPLWAGPPGGPPPPPPPPPPTTPYPVYPAHPARPAYPAYQQPAVPYVYLQRTHGPAQTSLWLGIAGLAGVLLTPFCCITLPLLVCSPVAWGIGASARRAIDAAPPGTWTNRGQAVAGMVMGIVGTALAALVVAGVVLLFGFAFSP